VTLAIELRRLEALIRTKRPRAYASLRPPADARALDALAVRAMGGRLPPDLAIWFGWHDGQSSVESFDPRNNYTPHTAEQALAAYNLLDDPSNEALRLCESTWIPLFTNGAGDHVVYDLRSGKLITYWHDDPQRPLHAPSLAAWALDVCEALDALDEENEPIAPYDFAGATWSAISAAPTKAELEHAPAGTAFRYGKKNWTPFDNGPFVSHLYVKTFERGWLASHGVSPEAAIAHHEGFCASPPAPSSGYWKSAEAVASALRSNWSLVTTTVGRRS